LANEEQGGGIFGGGPCGLMLPSMLIIAMLAYFMFLSPERKERQRREQLRKELKKNDRVVTIGGMLGTVASISPDGNEVVLKIDEATGAKLRILRSAIHEVLREGTKKEDAKKDESKKDDSKKDGSKKDELRTDEPNRDLRLEDTKRDDEEDGKRNV
jgi:preprotein translocase subunit YajC